MLHHVSDAERVLDAAERRSPDRLLDIGFAFRGAKTLMSAIEFDVFTALSKGPAECDVLMNRLGIHPRGARDFFDALVAMRLLRRDQLGRYSNSSDCERYLNRNSPDYLGDLFEHLNTRMYDIWGRLSHALRSGSPQSGALGNGGYAALYTNTRALSQFVRAMTAGSLMPAKALAAEFAWHKYTTFIDIGTAQGCVPVEIARAHPHLVGGGFDLPEVHAEFSAYVNDRGLASRLTFYNGDFFKHDLPSADVLIMGRILHNWGLATKKMLLHKAYRTLPSGGALIVYDPMLDEDRANSHALFASLTMLLETQEGFEYTATECLGWLDEAGFCGMHTIRIDAGHMAMIGYKNT
jgi:hypothetical protein